jgi:hypothetical protein
MTERFADLIGQVDVAFVVDTTGSMGPFIDAARQQIRTIAEEVAAKGDLDFRFAVVEYRDHPPQEPSFVERPYPFSDGDDLQTVLERLTPAGGGDAPEAVLDGLIAAANLQWRRNADRLCFLVGDAPPHGYEPEADTWPDGCPCRATPNGVVELLNGRTIRLHAITLTRNAALVRAFRELAEGTGGTLTEAPMDPYAAVRSTGDTLTGAGYAVEAGRMYMAAAEATGSYEPESVAEATGMPASLARSTVEYLRRRGIIAGTSDDGSTAV